MSTIESQALYYISGFIAYRILNDGKVLCSICKRLLQAKPNPNSLLQWEKEVRPNGKLPNCFFTWQQDFGGIHYVSPAIFNFISSISGLFRALYKQFRSTPQVLDHIRFYIMKRINDLPWLPSCVCTLRTRLIDESLKCFLNAELALENLSFKSCTAKNIKCSLPCRRLFNQQLRIRIPNALQRRKKFK